MANKSVGVCRDGVACVSKSVLLRESARGVGLCDEWYGGWGDDESDADLVRRYVRGIDFSVRTGWPDVGLIRSLFDASFLEGCGVYLDCVHDVCLERAVCVFVGDCDCEVSVVDFGTCTLHVLCKSRLRVCCGLGSRVQMRLHGGSCVTVRHRGGGRVTCFVDSGCVVRGDVDRLIER